MFLDLLFFVGFYFIGAIPFGFLIGKAHNIDIRQQGSKNIGATNVLRTLGKRWGYLCFLLDFLKGVGVIFLALNFTPSFLLLSFGLVVLGHIFPVFLKFKGGKGIATCLGSLIVLYPLTFIGLVIIWAGVFFVFGYVSVASIISGLFLPVFSICELLFFQQKSLDIGVVFLFIIPAVIIWRHRSNIARLLKGEEYSFKKTN